MKFPYSHPLLFLSLLVTSPSYSSSIINLNTAKYEELVSIGLTPKQAKNLISHQKLCGNLYSIYELQIVPDFNQETIDKILPFVYVEEFWPHPEDIFVQGKKFNKKKKYWRIMLRYGRVLERAKGYRNGRYIGTPDDFFTRVNFKHPQGYKFSFTFKKKDAEIFYPGHIGGYLFLEKKLFFDKFVVGDYQIGCGQSLVLNSTFSLFKNLLNLDLNKHNLKIRPNSSCSKYNFRGVASSVRFFDDFELVVFYSYRFLNADIKKGNAKISYYDHYKTSNDLTRRNALKEQTYGHILSWKKGDSEVGFNFIYNCFDHSIKDSLKNHFQGKQNYIGSVFGETVVFDRINIFGEFTYLKTFSFVLGGNITIFKHFSSALLVRHYSPFLHSFYGNPFNENSEKMNEMGICNVNTLKIQNCYITLSLDYFYFPYPTSKVYSDQYGNEEVLKILYKFNRDDLAYVRLKNKRKTDDREKNFYHLTTIQCVGQKKLGEIILGSQLVWGINHFKKKSGVGFLETLKYKWKDFNFNIFVGTALTNGVRVYLREPLLKFCGIKSKMYSVPMFCGGGIVSYKLGDNMSLEVLYNLSCAYRGDSVGNGLERIDGRCKNFIQMQVIYDF